MKTTFRNNTLCSKPDVRSLQRMELFAHSIRTTNRNPNVLPNVTLGFTILDNCYQYRVRT